MYQRCIVVTNQKILKITAILLLKDTFIGVYCRKPILKYVINFIISRYSSLKSVSLYYTIE